MSVALIEQAVRLWLKAAASLTDAQVILARANAPRPPMPYITVLVSSAGGYEGTDALRDGLSGSTPTLRVVGDRTATVSLQGYGAETHGWMQTAELGLSLPDIQDALDAAEIAFVRMSAPADISALVGTAFERRYSVDYEARYRVESSPVNRTAVAAVEAATTLKSYNGDPSPWTLTLPIL